MYRAISQAPPTIPIGLPTTRAITIARESESAGSELSESKLNEIPMAVNAKSGSANPTESGWKKDSALSTLLRCSPIACGLVSSPIATPATVA